VTPSATAPVDINISDATANIIETMSSSSSAAAAAAAASSVTNG